MINVLIGQGTSNLPRCKPAIKHTCPQWLSISWSSYMLLFRLFRLHISTIITQHVLPIHTISIKILGPYPSPYWDWQTIKPKPEHSDSSHVSLLQLIKCGNIIQIATQKRRRGQLPCKPLKSLRFSHICLAYMPSNTLKLLVLRESVQETSTWVVKTMVSTAFFPQQNPLPQAFSPPFRATCYCPARS